MWYVCLGTHTEWPRRELKQNHIVKYLQRHSVCELCVYKDEKIGTSLS